MKNKLIVILHGGLCSTSVINLTPGFTNIIPDSVTMTNDIRHPSTSASIKMEEVIQEGIRRLALDLEIFARAYSTEMLLEMYSNAVNTPTPSTACVRSRKHSSGASWWRASERCRSRFLCHKPAMSDEYDLHPV